jgi:hypothetical protein
MNDKELLEMAAKAAGVDGEWHDYASGPGIYAAPEYRKLSENNTVITQRKWNPLTDDGDALRLAGKLWMIVDTNNSSVTLKCKNYYGKIYDTDPGAATRYAIVRAAAEIGKIK